MGLEAKIKDFNVGDYITKEKFPHIFNDEIQNYIYGLRGLAWPLTVGNKKLKLG